MKESILKRTFVIILITITMILFLSWLLINLLADDIYAKQKLEQIKHVSKDIQIILNEDIEDTEAILRLKRLSITSGIDIHIFNDYNRPIYADYLMDREGKLMIDKTRKVKNIVPKIAFDLESGEDAIAEFQNPLDKHTRLLYMERYDNGILTVIQIPMQSIDETVNIFKDIIQYMILAALIFGLIGAYFISRNITKPLVELNNIAMEMGKLNFSYHYKDTRKDEIGQLGNTLNSMSSTLQETIHQLKEELEKEKTLDVLRKQFVAQVSHEIQTPLAIIQGYIEALEDGMVESEEEVKYHYEVINDEINKMVKILRDLLDLSQLEAGTFRINKEHFDIMTLLKSVSEKYIEISKKQNITLTFTQEKQKNMIYGDVFRLEQVLNNFIKNALEHTPPNGNIILNSETNKNKIKISIQNSGNPIPKEDLPYIWESFYKSKVKSQSKGTGLGLAISKQILNLHDAKYGAYNVDDGVVFWFEIMI